MDFIKTQNGKIIPITDKEYSTKLVLTKKYCGVPIKDYGNTVKVLCDRFIVVALVNKIKTVYTKKTFDKLQHRIQRKIEIHGGSMKEYLSNYKIFGAVWVEEGEHLILDTVAKMNEEWEFDLL